MSFLLLILIVIFSIVLIKAADMTVVSLRKLVRKSGIVGLSAVIIAIGTSFPELFVGVTSAVEGKPGLSLGVALGSNIANIALVGAGVALIAGRIVISEAIIKKVVWVSLVCGVLPYLLILDGNLNRIDGLIMVLAYLAYILSFFKGFYGSALKEHQEGVSFVKFFRRVMNASDGKWKSLASVITGIALMLFSADTIVKFSGRLAQEINISTFIIGLFIIAIGTSLPEFAFSLRSLKDKESEMFVGNLYGSIVANTTLVIGASVLINPITSLSLSRYLLPGGLFIFVYMLFYYFVRTKKRLERWEAGILLVIYILFFLIELR